jgi:hypothetical protein
MQWRQCLPFSPLPPAISPLSIYIFPAAAALYYKFTQHIKNPLALRYISIKVLLFPAAA